MLRRRLEGNWKDDAMPDEIREFARLERLTTNGACAWGACPAVFKSLDGKTYIIVGKLFSSGEISNVIGDGEAAIEISVDLLRLAIAKAEGGMTKFLWLTDVVVKLAKEVKDDQHYRDWEDQHKPTIALADRIIEATKSRDFPSMALVEAAPDLYAACKALVELYGIRPIDYGEENVDELASVKALTAIAKAEGKP
jgi:hypothetical protein